MKGLLTNNINPKDTRANNLLLELYTWTPLSLPLRPARPWEGRVRGVGWHTQLSRGGMREKGEEAIKLNCSSK
jgi:hypothetical protein